MPRLHWLFAYLQTSGPNEKNTLSWSQSFGVLHLNVFLVDRLCHLIVSFAFGSSVISLPIVREKKNIKVKFSCPHFWKFEILILLSQVMDTYEILNSLIAEWMWKLGEPYTDVVMEMFGSALTFLCHKAKQRSTLRSAPIPTYTNSWPGAKRCESIPLFLVTLSGGRKRRSESLKVWFELRLYLQKAQNN